ncbi:MAG: calcium/sodium antiporter [Coriobacteriia bacterium]
MSVSFAMIALFLVGLAVLCLGAELVVRGASRLAISLGIRPLVLGLTVVSIGTSVPELTVGITASAEGSGALAVGNIVGTNIVNILFILGLSAVLRPLPLQERVLRLELPVIIVSAVLMTGLAWDGVLSLLDGSVLLVAAILYTAAIVRISRSETKAVKEEYREKYGSGDMTPRKCRQTRGINFLMLIVGIGLSVLGAEWLVDGAVSIAYALGASEAVIGLTIVAIGTSAPEFVTTIISTLKNERDVAIGNLLGSSIYNILVILGITCIASPGGIPIEPQLLLADLPLMGGAALLCVPVFLTGRRVSRLEGAGFVAAYSVYLLLLVLFRT